jgi:asparagine synthase (glutamine-hydrolysing)
MTDQIAHRGPDAEGIWVDDRRRCILGHRRLSVIDTSESGRQPMTGANGRWVIAFNGEIYNFYELKRELEAKNIHFHGRTDTEVLIEAIALWGIDALPKLDGMFAFAAFDTLSGELILARDAFGEKPLYYVELSSGGYAFASELQALEKLPNFDKAVSLDAMAEVLMFQYIGAPRTIYSSVKKLPPGSWMRLMPQHLPQIDRFFEFRPGMAGFDTRPLSALIDELEEILLRSIKRRLISDVPLGAFLSGGVDSSTVCALIRKKLGLPLKTFSMGFRNASESEHAAAREMARQIGSDHREQILTPDTGSFLSDIGRVLDEPNGDSSCMPTYLLAKFARQHVTVAVSGDGGDEIFAGYGRYFLTLDEEQSHPPTWHSGRAYYSNRILVSTEKFIEELFGIVPAGLARHLAILRSELTDNTVPLFCRLRKTDVENYLPGAVLPKVDRMSMRHSLEVRTPFLNVELARFAERLPLDVLYRNGFGKLLLREVAYRYLPRKLVEAPKKGFGIPTSTWAREGLLKVASTLLESEEGRLREALGREAIDRFLTRQRSKDGFSTYQVWSLVMLESWLRHHPARLDEIPRERQEMAACYPRFSNKKLLARRLDSKTFLLVEEVPEDSVPGKAPADSETLDAPDYSAMPDWGGWRGFHGNEMAALQGAHLRIADLDVGLTIDRLALSKLSELGIRQIEYPHPYMPPGTTVRITIQPKKLLHRLGAFLCLRIKAAASLGWKRRILFIKRMLTKTLPRGRMLRLGRLCDGQPDQDQEMSHRYLLFEGLSQLPPLPMSHVEISELGDGRYSVWNGEIMFAPTRFRRLLTHSYWVVEHSAGIERHLEYVCTLVPPGTSDALAIALDNLQPDSRQVVPAERNEGPILVFTHGLPAGGAERQWCYLAIGLKQRGENVVFLSIEDLTEQNGHYLPLLTDRNVRVMELRKQPTPNVAHLARFVAPSIMEALVRREHPFNERDLFCLIALLHSLKPKAVIAQLDNPNLLAGTAALISGIPRTILSFRNYNPTHFSYLRNDWFRRYYSTIANFPQISLTGNSHEANADYAEWIGISSDRVHWIPNAIDSNSIKAPSQEEIQRLRRTLSISQGTPVILGVFRLSEEKRPLQFVEVCARIAEEVSDIRVLVAGVGPMHQDMQDRIENLGLEKQMTLLGLREDISALLSCASLLLLTSSFEGMPNVVMEAQLLGLPVVATKVGGTPDCVKDGLTGLLLPVDDVNGIAKACIAVVGSPELRDAMGRAARERMTTLFSRDAMVAGYLQLVQHGTS